MIAFPRMFSVSSNNIQTVENDNADRQSLKCILHTTVGELFGDPSFGCNLKSYLINIDNQLYRINLKEEIKNAANKYVNNIVVTDVKFNIVNPPSTNLSITIYYYTKATKQENSYTMNISDLGTITSTRE